MPDPGHDIFGPPVVPVECICLHCDRTYTSDLLVRIDVEGDGEEVHWMCPVPGCGAMGFGFDILPTDACDDDSPAGRWVDDAEEEFDDFADDEDNDALQEAISQEIADEVAAAEGQFEPPQEWSPGTDRDDDEIDGVDPDPFGLWDDSDEDDADPAIADAGDPVWEAGGRHEPIPFADDADADDRDGVTHPSMVFTRDDYEAAKSAGIYDEAIERERQHWRQIRQAERDRKARIERGETVPGDEFSEDDIPF